VIHRRKSTRRISRRRENASKRERRKKETHLSVNVSRAYQQVARPSPTACPTNSHPSAASPDSRSVIMPTVQRECALDADAD
jgi:hypothetical protein